MHLSGAFSVQNKSIEAIFCCLEVPGGGGGRVWVGKLYFFNEKDSTQLNDSTRNKYRNYDRCNDLPSC